MKVQTELGNHAIIFIQGIGQHVLLVGVASSGQ